MTSAPQNPSRTPNSGSASRRSNGVSLQTSAGNLHSTRQGVPGDRVASAGAGGKLAAEHAEPSANEASAQVPAPARAPSTERIPPC